MVKVEFIFTSLESDKSAQGGVNMGVAVEVKSTGLDTPADGPAHVYGAILMHKKMEVLKIISDEFVRTCEANGFDVVSTSVTKGNAGNNTVN
ncbi:hypothetical protein XG19_002246 [Salmonella enterica subsp. enterica serovar Gaminara]|nr:hypothetical protein [Salmonella enterica]EBV6969517.1 hypothetical protein [Salmonella enterica subsp. enterica serovar Gaminara]ECB4129739.1 hypothetical protein [Salmonella enterica subsp. enterica serovar Abony]ECN5156621.1 hypothetical protein [Salmonella enterica subsp. enterica serovar Newport]ECO0312756.1 hypothetical protein [Salmonella enterica subsp. enterica serovar Schwarzengrund]EDP8789441.1 hypothetical protein [Salmonella enterica subsp. enterica]EDT3964371.1 hypothetical p